MMHYDGRQLHNIFKLIDWHLVNHLNEQIGKGKEELKELIEQIEIYEDTKYISDELLDELFDADIMMMQLKGIFLNTVSNRIRYHDIVNAKINRELRRWDIK